jgi:phosphate transport system substrate-binding protein
MYRFLLCALVVLCSSGCKKPAAGSSTAFTIAGSTSVQPFAEKWAETFMDLRPRLQINVQGGGSTAGVRAAQTGAAQLGMVSRSLKSAERDLTSLVVAYDGIAVVVNRRNPINGLTLDAVRAIFSGATTRWKDLGGEDRPINVLSREEGSGTRIAFEDLLMKNDSITDGALVQDSTGALREMVSGDRDAIGYISLGLVNDRIKALPLSGVVASEANVHLGKYPLVRPFSFVWKGAPSTTAKAFLDFVVSSEGQALVREEGLISVK